MERPVVSLADVDVYRIARALTRDIAREAGRATPCATGESGPLNRILSLGQSVCQYIAQEYEAQRAASRPDFGGFLLRAVTACGEMSVWVACAQAQGLLPSDRAESWERSCRRICEMLEALYAHKSPDTSPAVAEAA